MVSLFGFVIAQFRGYPVPTAGPKGLDVCRLMKCRSSAHPPVSLYPVAVWLRSLEMQYMRLLVSRLLPMDFAEDTEWRILQQAHGKASFPPLNAERVHHLIVEMYDATKQVRAEVNENTPWYLAQVFGFSKLSVFVEVRY